MPTNETLLLQWTQSLRRRECAKATIYAFRRRVWLVDDHFCRPFGEITSDELEAFLDARDLGPKARYTWISTLHRFYQWCTIHHPDAVAHDPTLVMDRPKLRQGLPRPIPDDDLHAAVAAAEGDLKLWLVLAGWAGLRCKEIAEMQHDDVLIDEGLLLVRGKGNKERLVPVHARIAPLLPTGGRRGPMFQRPDGRVFTAARVSQIINAHFADLGMAWTAHQLRHRFATRVHNASGDLLVTQALLGHASPTTTAVYAKFCSASAAAAVHAVA
jgi:site-specific recombinase XerD